MSLFSFPPAEPISRTEPGFEEGERRTPWTGVLLLIIMFVAGLIFGWRALDDLARVPAIPTPLSYCSDRYRAPEAYRNVEVSSSLVERKFVPVVMPGDTFEPACDWNDFEKNSDIPALDQKRRDILKTLDNVASAEQQDLNTATVHRAALEAQYDQRLQEIQAGINNPNGVAVDKLQRDIEMARQEEMRLQTVVTQKITAARAASAELKDVERQLTVAYRSVFASHDRALRWYEFLVFLLQIIFIVPIFFIALRIYLKLLRRNSPYAIISTAIVGVIGVLLARVILMWFWDLFLAHVIEVLWRWIQNFQLLRSIVFYLGMVLSFVIFGGAVYYLQKRIFDPRRLAIRRFRQKQCPQCQTNLDLAGDYCPNCGHRVREQCPSCQQSRFVELPHCPQCGAQRAKS